MLSPGFMIKFFVGNNLGESRVTSDIRLIWTATLIVSNFNYLNKNKLTKKTVKILMRRLKRSCLIWISTVCKCMSEFT